MLRSLGDGFKHLTKGVKLDFLGHYLKCQMCFNYTFKICQEEETLKK